MCYFEPIRYLVLSLGADMRRREFIGLLGGAAAAWPVVVQAQQPERVRRIGVLMNTTADADQQANIATFRQALQQLGWIHGRNVRIDVRWAGGEASEIRRHANELVALAPDVIVATGNAGMPPLLQATHTVPIVFNNVADPVGAGYVESMARPDGNATGFIQFEYTLSGKWLELLKQIAPHVTRAAILRDPALAAGIGQFAVIQSVAPSVGVEVSAISVHDAGEIERKISKFANSPNGGLILTASAWAVVHRSLIIALAARHKLPAVYYRRTSPSRRLDLLWLRYFCTVQWRGRLRRSHPQGREASRFACASAEQVRTGDQSQDRQGARPRCAASFLARADEVIE